MEKGKTVVSNINLHEVENIRKILEKTKRSDVIEHPPYVTLDFMFVPDIGDNGKLFDFKSIYKKYEDHIGLRDFFKEKDVTNRMIFEEKLSEHLNRFTYRHYQIKNMDEYKFCIGLAARGSFADLIKCNFIIEFKDWNHLQTDTNTDIIDWTKLYEDTFKKSNHLPTIKSPSRPLSMDTLVAPSIRRSVSSPLENTNLQEYQESQESDSQESSLSQESDDTPPIEDWPIKYTADSAVNDKWNDMTRTIWAKQLSSCDSYGLSRCSWSYISCHNKIVYLCHRSHVPRLLKNELDNFIENNHSDPYFKHNWNNSMYDFVWVRAMFQNKSVHKFTVPDGRRPGKMFDFYPAATLDPRYTLNQHYVTVQRQSWRPKDSEDMKRKKDIDIKLDLGNNTIDISFYTIYTLIYLYTHIPELHHPKYSQTHFLYKYARIIDYITFLNKQPNEVNMKILEATFSTLGIDNWVSGIPLPKLTCLQEFNTLPCIPKLNDIPNRIRCFVKDINPDTFFDKPPQPKPKFPPTFGTMGGGPSEQKSIEDTIVEAADSLHILPEQLRDEVGPEPGPWPTKGGTRKMKHKMTRRINHRRRQTKRTM
jgi:hypothetical protein